MTAEGDLHKEEISLGCMDIRLPHVHDDHFQASLLGWLRRLKKRFNNEA
jgi:hypothetical protein